MIPPLSQAPPPARPAGEEPFLLGEWEVPRSLAYLAIGLPLAALLYMVACGLLSFGAQLLFHETGHAAAGWLCGHPAIPSARGFTAFPPRRLPIVFVVFGGILYGAWSLRDTPPAAIALGVAAVVQLLLSLSPLREDFFSLGGHLGELLFACLFLWRGAQGGFSQEWERPLYAMLGWCLWFKATLFLWGLLTDLNALQMYETGPSMAGGDNDLVKVSDSWGWKLRSVAGLLLVLQAAGLCLTLGLWWKIAGKPLPQRAAGPAGGYPPLP